MRYEVIKGSESSHCCFEATVTDTHKKCHGDHHDDWVCECFNVSRAHQIADALNIADEAPLDDEWVGQPTEEGRWWFYGTRYSDPERVLLYVTVFKTPDNRFMLVDGPSTMYKGMYEGKFQRITLPELPLTKGDG